MSSTTASLLNFLLLLNYKALLVVPLQLVVATCTAKPPEDAISRTASTDHKGVLTQEHSIAVQSGIKQYPLHYNL